MKLLFLMQGEQISDHPGLCDAFSRLKSKKKNFDYRVIPYFGYAKKFGWEAFYEEVVRATSEMKADAVFFHYFHHGMIPSPEDCITKLRQSSSSPLVVTSAGDPFSSIFFDKNFYPKSFRIASGMADLVFSTMMGRSAEKMKNWGAKNIVLLPNGICQARFDPVQNAAPPEFDVLFLGSNQRVRNPRQLTLGRQCWQRKKLIATLHKVYGERFGLFGKGWAGRYSDHGPFPFDRQLQYACKGRVLFGGYPGSLQDYYQSNRIFMQGAAPVAMVDWYVPRLDKIFRDGDHLDFCKSRNEMICKIKKLLELSHEELIDRGKRRSAYIFSKHTQYHRMKLAIEIIRALCLAKSERRKAPKPVLDFFLPEVNLDEETYYATCNWVG